jgi:glutamyl-tRNA synthetase
VVAYLQSQEAAGFFLATDDGCDFGFYDHLGLERIAARETPIAAEGPWESNHSTSTSTAHCLETLAMCNSVKTGALPQNPTGFSGVSGATQTNQPVVGRFAPTPSGRMHLGNVFSALMAWLSARSAGGRMIMRVEDLDPRAQDRAVARLLMDDLAWLGLDWDEGPYFQSERGEPVRRCDRAAGRAGPHLSMLLHAFRAACRNRATRLRWHLRVPGDVQEPLARGGCRESPWLRRPAHSGCACPTRTTPRALSTFDDVVYGPCSEVLARECGDFLGAQKRRRGCLPARRCCR